MDFKEKERYETRNCLAFILIGTVFLFFCPGSTLSKTFCFPHEFPLHFPIDFSSAPCYNKA